MPSQANKLLQYNDYLKMETGNLEFQKEERDKRKAKERKADGINSIQDEKSDSSKDKSG